MNRALLTLPCLVLLGVASGADNVSVSSGPAVGKLMPPFPEFEHIRAKQKYCVSCMKKRG